MRYLVIILFALSISCQAQSPEVDSDEALLVVDSPASFNGGWPAFFKYFSQNIKYPSQARQGVINLDISIEFVVNRDSTVSDVKVIKSFSSGIEEEAVRVIQNSPKWNPAHHGGKTVRQKLVLPIRICLGE